MDNVSIIVVDSTMSLEDFLNWCKMLQWPSCLINVPIVLPNWIHEECYTIQTIPSELMHPFEYLKKVSTFGEIPTICIEESLSLNDSMIQSTITKSTSISAKGLGMDKYSQFNHSNHTIISDIPNRDRESTSNGQLTSSECLIVANSIDFNHLREIVQFNVKNKYEWR